MAEVQPLSVCQASRNAISTEADELRPEPRGTLEAKTAFMPGVSSLLFIQCPHHTRRIVCPLGQGRTIRLGF